MRLDPTVRNMLQRAAAYEVLSKAEGEKCYALPMLEVNNAILKERLNQNKKWGVQRHPHEYWHVIASEEAGEVAQDIQNFKAAGDLETLRNLYTEIVQTAAVYQAFGEQVRLEIEAMENTTNQPKGT